MLLTSLLLKCSLASRCHHLLKTFYVGRNGWHDRQLSDGTVIWTSPTGHTYTTKPGGSLFFPTFATATGDPPTPPPTEPPHPNRGALMPARSRTRAQDRAYGVGQERRINGERIAHEQRLLEERIAANDEPPPF